MSEASKAANAMGHTKIDDVKRARLANTTVSDRLAFDHAYSSTRLALHLGERVRDERQAAGLSQRELASRMGTSQATVARVEAGAAGATLTTIQNVATALGLRVTIDLVERAERP